MSRKRLQDFTAVNPGQYVQGERPTRVFKRGEEPAGYEADEDLGCLLHPETESK